MITFLFISHFKHFPILVILQTLVSTLRTDQNNVQTRHNYFYQNNISEGANLSPTLARRALLIVTR
jgi:hypothetical protein